MSQFLRQRTQIQNRTGEVSVRAQISMEDTPTNETWNFIRWGRSVKPKEQLMWQLSPRAYWQRVPLAMHTGVASSFQSLRHVRFSSIRRRNCSQNLNGTVRSGEMLVVLGRPGSGCSTFLKSICGESHGLEMKKGSTIHFDGIEQEIFLEEFKGEVVYNQEVENHFPHLNVGETLGFVAAARTPPTRIKRIPREAFSKHMASVMMNIFGLRHTTNTNVGNDFVRGVSGGERKRVSIAEMALAGSSFYLLLTSQIHSSMLWLSLRH
jgi:ABC-type branched-subunit amino acid transport system ATPase component